MSDNTKKTFWDRPEGTTGKIIVGFAGAAGLLVFYKVLPFLITLAENTLYLGALCVALWLFYMLVTSERVKTLVFLAFSQIARSITSIFVNIDPVGILKEFVRDMKKKRETVQDAIASMMGVRQKSTQALKQREREMEEALKLANAAEQMGNEEQMNLQLEIIARRQRAIQGLQSNIAFANETVDALQRVDRVIEYHIANSEDEIKDLEHDNAMALQMLAATAAASEALGDSDLREISGMAADVIRERVAKATGEVEHLLATTRGVQGEIDLKQLTLRADGRAKLEALRASVGKAELGAAKTPKAVTAGAAQPTFAGSRWADRVNVNRK